MKKRPRRMAFFFGGFFVGMAVTTLLVAGILYNLTNRGVVVTIKTDELACYIGDQIERQAARELPQVLKEVKAQVPALVKKQMQKGNMKAEIKISDISIILPPSALAELDGYLQETVEITLYRLLDGMELDALASNLGHQAREMVAKSLGEELAIQQALSIETWWGRIPVFLDVGQGEEQAKDRENY